MVKFLISIIWENGLMVIVEKKNVIFLTFAWKSAAPEAAREASLLMSTPHTQPLWPSNVPIQSPVSPCRNIGFPSVKNNKEKIFKCSLVTNLKSWNRDIRGCFLKPLL